VGKKRKNKEEGTGRVQKTERIVEVGDKIKKTEGVKD